MGKISSAVRMSQVASLPSRTTSNHRPHGPTSGGDLNLLARLRVGDESALVQLVQTYQGPLLRLAMTLLQNRAIAEEVVQEAWMFVIDGLGSFEGRSSLKTWIFRILTNRAKTRMAREARSIPFSALGPADSDESEVDSDAFLPDGRWAEPPARWNDDNAEKLLMQKQAMRRLERALRDLPPAQCAVVTLRDVEGLDSEEVCNVLGIAETNQRVLLHRGRSKLRQALGEHLLRT